MSDATSRMFHPAVILFARPERMESATDRAEGGGGDSFDPLTIDGLMPLWPRSAYRSLSRLERDLVHAAGFDADDPSPAPAIAALHRIGDDEDNEDDDAPDETPSALSSPGLLRHSSLPLPTIGGAEIRNVLLLSIEDLNDWIEPLGGHPQTLTPNLSRLARRSAVFFNAEAPAPACGPSRNATLFGQAPWRTGLYMNKHDWRTVFKDSSSSLVGVARAAGWDTIGTGKVFYKPIEDGLAWNRSGEDFRDKRFAPISRSAREGKVNWHFDFGPAPDHMLPLGDDRNVDYITSTMKRDSCGTMWGIGIVRPHPPFVCPRKYWDMFKGPIARPPGLGQGSFDPANESVLNGLPETARDTMIKRELGRTLFEMGEYEDFVRGYLASIAYADAMAGRVLDHLDSLGLTESTLIVLWSDHGWQLGEKLAFKKFSLWDRALRVPFFFAGPGIRPRVIDEPVSLMDFYPTVANLLGLTAPHPLDGDDLTDVLTGDARPRGVATSAWAVGSKREINVALTVRTAEFRLIRYWDGATELYDSELDPFEHYNLLHGSDPSGNLAGIVDDLVGLLPTPRIGPRRSERLEAAAALA